MKRLLDLCLALFALLFLLLPFLVVAVMVRLTSTGPILFWSDRVGRNNAIFKMPKFRSMRIDTPAVATHLLSDPKQFLTPVGSFLRKSSLDELPQLCVNLQIDITKARTLLGWTPPVSVADGLRATADGFRNIHS